MKPERLEELKRICEAATDGPWRYEKKEHWPDCAKRPDYIDGVWLAHDDFLEVHDEGEAKFIAEARTAIPELLAEVERLQSLVSCYRMCCVCL
jgi:hypothetical protein